MLPTLHGCTVAFHRPGICALSEGPACYRLSSCISVNPPDFSLCCLDHPGCWGVPLHDAINKDLTLQWLLSCQRIMTVYQQGKGLLRKGIGSSQTGTSHQAAHLLSPSNIYVPLAAMQADTALQGI